MARVRHAPGGRIWIAAEGAAERHLLASGVRAGGRIVLEGSYYQVTAEALRLPDGISPGGCERLARAFERAARSHELAVGQRRGFRVVDDEG